MPLFIGASESYDTDAWEAYNLKKENTKLQQQLADVTESMRRVEERCAKLRELCADLRFCKRNNCLKCSHGRFCDMRFDDRYAELGIEASE